MKKIGFLFMLICILALSANICYASDYDNELYGEVNQTDFEFAVLADGNYLITVVTSNSINSIALDENECNFNANESGYELNITIPEGIHYLSVDTDDEAFCADLIRIASVASNKAYTIYADDYSSHNFDYGSGITASIDSESVEGLNFVDADTDADGRTVSYTFEVADDGLYSVISYISKDGDRWTSTNTSYIDGVKLELAGSTEEGIEGDTYITQKIFSEIELSAGEHTLRIDAAPRTDSDYRLRYYMTSLEYLGGNDEAVSRAGLAEIKIQAESYTALSQEILNADKKVINPVVSIATADGGAAVRVNTTEAPDNGGYSFTYNVNVPKSGIYNFYIHGGATTSRYISPIEYSINGSEFVSVSESFTKYKNSEIAGYEDLAGHHYHIEGIYLEAGEQELVIRCSQVRASDSSTYYIFLDSMTFVETGIHISDIENAELNEELEITIDASLPGRIRGDIADTAVEYSSVESDAISIENGVIKVNGGGVAEVKAVLSTTDEDKALASYEAAFSVNTTIDDIGVCEHKAMADGSFGAVIKNYGDEKKSFCLVKIQREESGIVKTIELKNYTLSAGGTVVAAIESQDSCSAEMFIISSQNNYAPVSDYLND